MQENHPEIPDQFRGGEAHAILRRLGEEAYSSQLDIEHRHIDPITHHTAPTLKPQTRLTRNDETVPFDWAGLLSVILTTSKMVLGVIAFFGILLFGFLGPFLLLPLIAFVLLTGPFRQLLKPQQRREMNAFVVRANAYIKERRKTGTGFT